MTITDAQGNLHDGSGKFAEKTNSAPAGLTTEAATTPTTTPEIVEAAQLALDAYRMSQAAARQAAGHAYDAIRAMILHRHPTATKATFTRDWEGEAISLNSVVDAEGNELPLYDNADPYPSQDDLAMEVQTMTTYIEGFELEFFDDEGHDHFGYYEWFVDLTLEQKAD